MQNNFYQAGTAQINVRNYQDVIRPSFPTKHLFWDSSAPCSPKSTKNGKPEKLTLTPRPTDLAIEKLFTELRLLYPDCPSKTTDRIIEESSITRLLLFHLMTIVPAGPTANEVFLHLFASWSVEFSQRDLPFSYAHAMRCLRDVLPAG